MTDDFRIQALERDVEAHQARIEVIAVLEAKIENMGREIGELKTTTKEGFNAMGNRFDKAENDQKMTRRVTMAFAFTVAGSCVTILLTLLATGVI